MCSNIAHIVAHTISNTVAHTITHALAHTIADAIPNALTQNRAVVVPTAPELGLFLVECLFHSYNKAYRSVGNLVCERSCARSRVS